MIFTIFTNIPNFNVLLASVSIACIGLEINCYKPNKLKEYRVHPAKIYSHCYGFLITALLVCLGLKTYFHNFTNLANFNVLLTSVSLMCIEFDNYFYQFNKIRKYSDYFSLISSYFNGFLISASVV